MQQATPIGVAQSMETWLTQTVPDIFKHKQRLVQKNLFGLCLADIVFICTLTAIAFIPVKARCVFYGIHLLYIPHIYIKINLKSRKSVHIYQIETLNEVPYI